MTSNRKEGVICKVDMEKAYDRVECDFLFWVIKKRALMIDG